jgi:hypothetical protein
VGGAAVPAATASVGDRRGIMLETCTAAAPGGVGPWLAQEVRRAGLTAMLVARLGVVQPA